MSRFGLFLTRSIGCVAVVAAFSDVLAVADEPAGRAKAPVAAADAKAHPLEAALELARQSRDAAAALDDYQATFSKKELVGQQLIPLTMDIKFRTKPFSAYLRFHKPHEGREVLYVEGRNGGKLLAHETGLAGLVGTVSLVPTSAQAMSEGRYPITRFGLENMAEGVIGLWEAELKHEPPEVKYYPNAKLAGMECRVIESVHPKPQRHFPFHRTRLYIDKATGLPVRVEQNGYPAKAGAYPPIIEEYTYSNLRTNVGLRDADFDSRNPKYGF
jgi:hypothetical protein